MRGRLIRYMTLQIPEGDDRSQEEILALAEKHFQRLLKIADEVADGVRQGDARAARELQTVARDLGKSTQTLFDERSKVDKLRKHVAGVVHDYALDFETARAEIGRRLDSLRAAADPGSVSE